MTAIAPETPSVEGFISFLKKNLDTKGYAVCPNYSHFHAYLFYCYGGNGFLRMGEGVYETIWKAEKDNKLPYELVSVMHALLSKWPMPERNEKGSILTGAEVLDFVQKHTGYI